MSRIPITFGLALTVLVTAAACGSNDDATTAGTAKVAAVIKGLDNPFFQSMEKGIKEQAQTSGTAVTVQAANSITDTTGQADKLTGLAGQDFSCYIVNPISGTNLIQGIAQLAAKKKTIVNIDSPVEAAAAKAANAAPATYIGTNNTSAGQQAGEQMLKLLPGGGKVAAIGGIAGDVTSGQRIDGFSQAITGKLELVQTVAANWERQEALTQATNLMRAQPDLKGFFVANDDMGLGVARAVATSGKTGQIKIISVDGIKDALSAVKAGQVDAVVAQYPYAIGLMGMEACQAAAKGKTLPATVEAPVEVVTKENADQALAATPKPFGTYADPFKTLLGS
ncbi:substrate-binding domain-containing protein [Actinoplanes palleronii]|uniref:LacI family transcriptional regulator n=1 Tax=Actinoplanes palleronii TaxID=113570 RepID=A0ABQ4BQD6_9ACTN|nr:substrate-binding domain-containing protein [Actinoplanes palleronii]GIE72837.1 LacI family transcriptional regulator [Actinoplanes palleronii]